MFEIAKLPSEKEKNEIAKQKLEKMFKRLAEQYEYENEKEGRKTTEDGQPPLTGIAKTKTKYVSQTQTEAVEAGGTQTTQNSIQASKVLHLKI